MKSLKIGFDAKRIYNNSTGLGVYGRGLVESFIKEYPQHYYYLFTPQQTNRFLLENNNSKVVTSNSYFRSLWRSFGINNDIKKLDLDIYHGLSNEIPFKLNKSTRYVCTVHDLIWLKMPENYKLMDRYFYTKKIKHATMKSDIIIATSKQTSNDLQEFLSVSENKIRVLYQSGTEVPKGEYINPMPGQSYFLYLSSFQKRKNHLLLLKAYSQIKDKCKQKLVLAGKEGETIGDVKRFVQNEGLHDFVKIITNLSEFEKYSWLKFADAFVYPSSNEGFGIPLLEAMQLGKPLILNNIPVFKEIAEDKAEYFSLNIEGDLGSKLLNFNYREQDFSKLLFKFTPKQISKELHSIYQELV